MSTHPSKGAQNEEMRRTFDLWVTLFRIILVSWLPVVVATIWWMSSKEYAQDDRINLLAQAQEEHAKKDTISRDVMEKADLTTKLALMERVDSITERIDKRVDKQEDTIKSLPSADFRADYSELKRMVASNNETLIKVSVKLDTLAGQMQAKFDKDRLSTGSTGVPPKPIP